MKKLAIAFVFALVLQARDATWNDLMNEGGRAFVDRRYREAENFYLQALRQLENAPDSDLRLSGATHQLAIVYMTECRFQEAEHAALRAIALRARIPGGGSLTAASELVLGSIYRLTGRYSKAERITRDALSIFQREGSSEDVGVAHLSLTTVLASEYKLSEAEDTAQQALQIWPDDQKDRIFRSGAFHALAEIHISRRDYKKAAEYCDKALAALEAEFGPGHPRLVPVLTRRAYVELMMKHYPEAERVARRGVDISTATLGDQHIDTAHATIILAKALAAQSRAVEAEPLFQSALPLLARILGSEHAVYGEALLDYADFLRKAHRAREAKQISEQAALILAASRGTIDVGQLRRPS